MRILHVGALALLWLALVQPASAQSTPPPTPAPEEESVEPPSETPSDTTVRDTPTSDAGPSETPPSETPAEEAAEHEGPEVTATFAGYVEANYTYSFAQPSNGVIALRAFDNQHNTFTLANVAFFARLDYDRVYASIGVQWGNTPTTYYLAEPGRPSIGGTGPSDASTWRWLQNAFVGWTIPVDSMHVNVEGGLFLSPIGFEGMQVAQNWNFSRSNLFYGCPFYHSGVRAQLVIDDAWSVTAGVWNGWNTLLDNNDEKSISIQADYTGTGFAAHLLYFTGVERNPGYAGGRPWRHLFDFWMRGDATSWLTLAVHANAGFEPSSIGLTSWEAVAGYARVVPISWMAISLRGDFFREDAAADAMGVRSPIFWPAEWVSGATATLSFRPVEVLTFYIEYRHDHAAGSAYYAGAVPLDAQMMPTVLNADHQDTLTLGVTANISGITVH